ncbi:MAG TPA: type II secretion system protein E [Elusimicrobia bacterium]|nr:type II secretion system protein E [Elusimicrobiota bacterium]
MSDPKEEDGAIDQDSTEVEKLVNAILLHAIKVRASDIHIEPFPGESVAVRYRIDGVLAPGPFGVPGRLRSLLNAKIKIMTGVMDITERRLPQTGRIQVLVQGNPVDLHVEMLPTLHGEACVLRVLDRASLKRGIGELGFLPDTFEKLLALFKGIGGRRAPGLVLVSGLAKTGKTTTLYSLLDHLKRPEIKIVTVESPVEYELEGILQVPANPGLGFDFTAALRSIRRFDPDVVMTGEIGDAGTAELTLKTAMSGLVFSTVFTEDAPSAVSRLLEMGLEPTLVAAALKAVLAQRLARRLCACRKPCDPSMADVLVFKEHAAPLPAGAKLFEAAGCGSCGGTGYRGRIGLQELLIMDDGLRGACLRGGPEALRAAARNTGMRTLVQDGLQKALEGLTSVREVLDSTF